MSRRLPVYILIDTSASMAGEPIKAVKAGLELLIKALMTEPEAIETAHISVITFESKVEQIVPLTELASFKVPKLKTGAATSMGEALTFLVDCVNKELRTGSDDVKPDWRPLVFLLTDGNPTDNLQIGIDAIKKVKFANFVACAAGEGAKIEILKKITNDVVSLKKTNEDAIKAFFKWVSESVRKTSKKVNLKKQASSDNDDNGLPPPPPEIDVIL